MKIHVIDKDDNNPIFAEKNLTRGVRVNAPIYTEIGRVTATDADAEAEEIKYKLENVTFVRPSTRYRKVLGPSAFLVDPLTGVIQTNQSYGRYSDGYFDVVIKAHNSPDPEKRDLAFMKVRFAAGEGAEGVEALTNILLDLRAARHRPDEVRF